MAKIDPSKMTTDQIRDWLAVHRHHEQLRKLGSAATTDDFYRDPAPIPATLDAAAAAMPENWTWWRELDYYKGERLLRWLASDLGTVPKEVGFDDTGNEIDDRFRLAMLCILAEESAHAK